MSKRKADLRRVTKDRVLARSAIDQAGAIIVNGNAYNEAHIAASPVQLVVTLRSTAHPLRQPEAVTATCDHGLWMGSPRWLDITQLQERVEGVIASLRGHLVPPGLEFSADKYGVLV